MAKDPLILEIKGNSLDDGPGIRTVIFFKGCPLSCVWCHNPESKKREVEISFDADKCIGCDTCLDYCEKHALDRSNPLYIDRQRCDLCFTCVEQCPSESLSRVGMQVPVEEIISKTIKDKPFFDTSGGGVTFSGGEPLLYPEFVGFLLRTFKSEKIHTLIETAGLFRLETVEKLILPRVDAIYCDIKLFNESEHKNYCGVSNKLILKNIKQLYQLSRRYPFELLPRVPLIPGITDTDENLKGIAGFLSENRFMNVQLLNYNPLWHRKCEKIGLRNDYTDDATMARWIDKEKIVKYQQIFLDCGLEVL